MAKNEPIKIDPRVEAMFRPRPPAERFLAFAVCALLGPRVADVLQHVDGGGQIDWSEKVAGHPLLHFNGKTVAKIRAEGHSEETIRKVRQAFEARGVTLDEGEAITPVFDEDAPIPEREAPPAPPAETTGNPDGTGGSNEPTFAGKPLTYFAGMSAEQIKAVEGITDDDVLAIQEALS